MGVEDVEDGEHDGLFWVLGLWISTIAGGEIRLELRRMLPRMKKRPYMVNIVNG